MANYIPSFYRYVSSITIANAGAGYNNVPTITITGGGGTGATATATVFSGVITGVTVTNPGTGYTDTPTITITPNSLDTITTDAVLSAVLDAAQGNSSIETTNSSYLIQEQVPEFMKTEHPMFVTFLEKYYSFMDTQYKDVRNYKSDVDLSSEAFLDKWRGALVSDFPKSLKLDRSFFYKHAKDFYEAKGSRRSIETFFRVLFGENVEVSYPYQYVLKPSDGIYNVETAIKIQEAEHGGGSLEPLSLEGKKIDIRYKETTGTVTITKTTNASVRRVEKNTYQTNGLTLQRFELILSFDDAGVTTVHGPGAGLTATANINVLTGATITAAGTGYTSAPTVAFSGGGGSGAAATANISGGAVTELTITNGGTGYTSAPTMTFSGGGGSGAAATATGWNTVSSITVNTGGTGYNAAPPITIKSGGGTGATAHALVSNGVVTSIVVDSAGSDYTTAPTVEESTDTIRSYVVDDGAANSEIDIYGYIVRVLTGVTFKSYAGSEADAGFKIGQIYAINEQGDDGKAYAISGYFGEDYTFIGGSNDAFIRITAVTSAGLPSAFTVINPGSTFLKDTADINIVSPKGEIATITLTTGYLFEYEGKWKNDQGKLSDVNVLQDNKRYQQYSYVIKSGIAQTTWDRPIRDAVHPSGMEVFGDLIIKSEVVFNTQFSVQTTGTIYYIFKSTDEATTSEQMAFTTTRVSTDTATTSESIAKNFIPAGKTESVSAADQGSSPYVLTGYWDDDTDGNTADNYNIGEEARYIDFNKISSDSVTTSDSIAPEVTFIRTLTDGPTVSDVLSIGTIWNYSHSATVSDSFVLTYFRNLTETISVSESNTLEINKPVSESLTGSEAIDSINTSKGITETQSVAESLANALTKPAVVDSASATDTGIGSIHDYVDPTYLAEDYVGTGWNFT